MMPPGIFWLLWLMMPCSFRFHKWFQVDWIRYVLQVWGSYHLVRRNNSDVTVIVPALNEEEGVGATLLELRDVLGDPFLLVVDGNRVDDTVKVADDLGA